MAKPPSPPHFIDLAFPTRGKPHPSSYLPLYSSWNIVVLILCAETLKISKSLFLVIFQIYTIRYELFSRDHRPYHFRRATFKDRCLLPWNHQYHIIPCILGRCHGIILVQTLWNVRHSLGIMPCCPFHIKCSTVRMSGDRWTQQKAI